ncbi:MAG: HIRAN domain-containing protein [Rhodocyclaceae bacterium]
MRFVWISLLWLSLAAHADSIKLLVQSSPLAGFQYHAGAAVWDQLRVGDPLALIREPDNPFDRRAVRIEWQGVMLGYLPRAENEAVAAAMDRGERVEGRIAALVEHKNPWRRLRIDIFVVF